MRNCKFHSNYEAGKCKWCKRWRKTYNYFKARGCKKLTFYWIIMEHYRTGETFQKVGLTSQTVEQRFDHDLERFKMTVKHTREFPLYAAVTYENHTLHQLEKDGRLYNPKARIGGWSECFI